MKHDDNGSLSTLPQPPTTDAVQAAVAEATLQYLNGCRNRIKPFARQHFSFRGAARLNRRALGLDMIKTSLNVAWSVPYLASRGGAALSKKLGMRRVAAFLDATPPGFRTAVERELEWLIYSELLELPYQQGERRCERDALFEQILAHPRINARLLSLLMSLDERAGQPGFRVKLENHLRGYTASRTAATELSGALLNLAAGAAMFHKLTPGALAMGSTTAAAIAQQTAVANFALGPTLGSLYYGFFPATAGTGLLVTTTGGLILALAVLTAGAGVITDPVQQALGLHERKLHRLVDALEAEITGKDKGLKIRDAYVARVFDLWDLLQTSTRAVL
jgi:hypothetical protein